MALLWGDPPRALEGRVCVSSGSASRTGDFEPDTPVTQPVPGNPETIPGIHNSHQVGLGGIYSTPRDKSLLEAGVATLIRCSGWGVVVLSACFFRVILDSQWLGMGTRVYHIACFQRL